MLRNKVDFEETTALALKLAGQTRRSASADGRPAARPAEAARSTRSGFLEAVATADARPRRSGPRRSGACSATPTSPRPARRPSAALAADRPAGRPARRPRSAPGSTTPRTAATPATPATFVKLAEGPDAGRGVLGYGVLLQVDANTEAPEAARADARTAIERGLGEARGRRPAPPGRRPGPVASRTPRRSATASSRRPTRGPPRRRVRRPTARPRHQAGDRPGPAAEPIAATPLRAGPRRRPQGQGRRRARRPALREAGVRQLPLRRQGRGRSRGRTSATSPPATAGPS